MVCIICKVFFKLLLWFLDLQLVSLYGEALETLGGGVSLVDMGHDRQDPSPCSLLGWEPCLWHAPMAINRTSLPWRTETLWNLKPDSSKWICSPLQFCHAFCHLKAGITNTKVKLLKLVPPDRMCWNENIKVISADVKNQTIGPYHSFVTLLAKFWKTLEYGKNIF